MRLLEKKIPFLPINLSFNKKYTQFKPLNENNLKSNSITRRLKMKMYKRKTPITQTRQMNTIKRLKK